MTSSDPSAARPRARLIIPVWGEKYVDRLDLACIPAVLAPGNLPYLAAHFDCELAIVTQDALFDRVRSLPSIQAAQRHCRLKLIAMDDVMSHPSYYGYTITQALYRGFTEMGEAAKDTWCLFLNADFIIADGSYRALASRMLAGERVIMAPSYCTIEEDVRPLMDRRIAEAGAPVLSIPPRVMADMVLTHRHFTIRSKIINWRMYRIDRVDQFYYQVDNDTMLGKQLPIAIVAFRPERVPPEPVTFWDYGVVAEICPTSRLCVIEDSDDFLMLELRGRKTMSDQLQLGWMNPDEIARDITLWTTKDQRDCGAFTMVVHRKDLPAETEKGREVLEEYFRRIMSRAAPEPRDHRDHYIWTGMIRLHHDWLESRGRVASAGEVQAGADPSGKPAMLGYLGGVLRALLAMPFSRGWAESLYRRLHDLLRAAYRRLYGRVPEIGPLHPLWNDLDDLIALVRGAAGPGAKALSLWGNPGALVAPHLSRWFQVVKEGRPSEVLVEAQLASLAAGAPYDLCFIEVGRDEFLKFGRMHARLRDLVRKGGKIVVYFRTRGMEYLHDRDFELISKGMPETDIAELRFKGGRLTHWLQRSWDRHLALAARGNVLDLVRCGVWAMLVAMPVAMIIWSRSGRAGPSDLPDSCTSLCLEVTVL